MSGQEASALFLGPGESWRWWARKNFGSGSHPLARLDKERLDGVGTARRSI